MCSVSGLLSVCAMLSMCVKEFQRTYCLHPYIDSLQDVDAEMAGRKEFGLYRKVGGGLVRGSNKPMGVSSKNGSWTDASGEL